MMEELINVFANNNILILGIVLFVFGLILLGYLLTLILSSKKQLKEEVVEIEEPNNKKTIEEIFNEPKVEMTEVKEEIVEVKEENVVELNEKIEPSNVIEPNEKIEIDEIVENKEQINQVDNQKEQKITNDLEEVLLKMQKTLDEKEEIDNIERFEREQEENAIISYQELLRRAKKDFPQMEINVPIEPTVNKVEDTSSVINTVNEIVENNKNVNVVETEVQPVNEVELQTNQVIEEKTKPIETKIPFDNPNYEFKSNIFISPIGVTNYDNPNYYKEVKISRDYLREMADSRFNTVDIEAIDIDYETKQNEKFLEDLKSFRSNL